MADYAELTAKNMEEYSKLISAIYEYVEFLKDSRELSRERIIEVIGETTRHAVTVAFMERK